MKWLLRVLLALAVLGAGAAWLLDRAFRDTELARVPIPGSDLTLVLSKDFKHMHRYRIFEAGRPVSEFRLLTGPMQEDLSDPRAERDGDRVVVRWQGPGRSRFVELDLGAARIVGDSGDAHPAPLAARREP